MPIDYAKQFAEERDDQDVPAREFGLKPEVWALVTVEGATTEMNTFATPHFPRVSGKLRIAASAKDANGREARGMEFFRIGRPPKTHPEYVHGETFTAGPNAGMPNPDAGKPNGRWGREAGDYAAALAAILVHDAEGNTVKERDADAKAKVAAILSSAPYLTIAQNAGDAVVQVDHEPVTDELRAAMGRCAAVAAAIEGRQVLVKFSVQDGKRRDGTVFSEALAAKPRNGISNWMAATPENVAKYVTEASGASGGKLDRF